MRFLIVLICFLLFSSSCFAKEVYNGSGNIYESLYEMEKQIYSKDYSQDDFCTRMGRLEMSIFGKKSDYPLYDRLNALKKALSESDARNSNINKQVILDLLEKRYFNRNYNEDSVENRITRLEQRILGSAFSGNIDERFNYLIENVPMGYGKSILPNY